MNIKDGVKFGIGFALAKILIDIVKDYEFTLLFPPPKDKTGE